MQNQIDFLQRVIKQQQTQYQQEKEQFVQDFYEYKQRQNEYTVRLVASFSESLQNIAKSNNLEISIPIYDMVNLNVQDELQKKNELMMLENQSLKSQLSLESQKTYAYQQALRHSQSMVKLQTAEAYARAFITETVSKQEKPLINPVIERASQLSYAAALDAAEKQVQKTHAMFFKEQKRNAQLMQQAAHYNAKCQKLHEQNQALREQIVNAHDVQQQTTAVERRRTGELADENTQLHSQVERQQYQMQRAEERAQILGDQLAKNDQDTRQKVATAMKMFESEQVGQLQNLVVELQNSSDVYKNLAKQSESVAMKKEDRNAELRLMLVRLTNKREEFRQQITQQLTDGYTAMLQEVTSQLKEKKDALIRSEIQVSELQQKVQSQAKDILKSETERCALMKTLQNTNNVAEERDQEVYNLRETRDNLLRKAKQDARASQSLQGQLTVKENELNAVKQQAVLVTQEYKLQRDKYKALYLQNKYQQHFGNLQNRVEIRDDQVSINPSCSSNLDALPQEIIDECALIEEPSRASEAILAKVQLQQVQQKQDQLLELSAVIDNQVEAHQENIRVASVMRNEAAVNSKRRRKYKPADDESSTESFMMLEEHLQTEGEFKLIVEGKDEETNTENLIYCYKTKPKYFYLASKPQMTFIDQAAQTDSMMTYDFSVQKLPDVQDQSIQYKYAEKHVAVQVVDPQIQIMKDKIVEQKCDIEKLKNTLAASQEYSRSLENEIQRMLQLEYNREHFLREDKFGRVLVLDKKIDKLKKHIASMDAAHQASVDVLTAKFEGQINVLETTKKLQYEKNMNFMASFAESLSQTFKYLKKPTTVSAPMTKLNAVSVQIQDIAFKFAAADRFITKRVLYVQKMSRFIAGLTTENSEILAQFDSQQVLLGVCQQYQHMAEMFDVKAAIDLLKFEKQCEQRGEPIAVALQKIKSVKDFKPLELAQQAQQQSQLVRSTPNIEPSVDIKPHDIAPEISINTDAALESKECTRPEQSVKTEETTEDKPQRIMQMTATKPPRLERRQRKEPTIIQFNVGPVLGNAQLQEIKDVDTISMIPQSVAASRVTEEVSVLYQKISELEQTLAEIGAKYAEDSQVLQLKLKEQISKNQMIMEQLNKLTKEQNRDVSITNFMYGAQKRNYKEVRKGMKAGEW